MKAHNHSKGRSTLPRRSQEAPNVDQILSRIKAVTGELEALQSEIHQHINHGTGRNSGREEAPRARLLGEFKITLDRLRKVLWLYLEQVTSQPASGLKPREPEAAPLPRAIYPQSTPADAPNSPPGSFFERLDVVIDAYMKNASTRDESGPRKRAKN